MFRLFVRVFGCRLSVLRSVEFKLKQLLTKIFNEMIYEDDIAQSLSMDPSFFCDDDVGTGKTNGKETTGFTYYGFTV